jgi:hypothetical protein
VTEFVPKHTATVVLCKLNSLVGISVCSEISDLHGWEYKDGCLLEDVIALMMEATSISETSVNSTRLHGATT